MRLVIGGLFLLLGPSLLADQAPPTPRERYQALLKRHDAPRQDFNGDRARTSTACADFLKLAVEHPSDPAAFDSLRWVVTHTMFSPEAGRAMDLLARDHAGNEGMAAVCRELDRLHGGDFAPLVSMLREVLSDNPHRESKAWACFALARRLKEAKGNAEREQFEHDLSSQGKMVYHVPAPELSREALGQLAAESVALFRRVEAEFGDLDAGFRRETLGRAASRESRELLDLAVGEEAPEITGKDLDGKSFRLSDYRGKVVLLDFWNHRSCGVCRSMYPQHRELVERLKGKPFAMLGINSDDDLTSLRALRDQGVVTWRAWFDGPSDTGPIAQRWNVQGRPTIYILDHKGVIRAKGFLQDPFVAAAVDDLLNEMGPARRRRTRRPGQRVVPANRSSFPRAAWERGGDESCRSDTRASIGTIEVRRRPRLRVDRLGMAREVGGGTNPMTRLLDQAIARARQLPEADQEAIASIILQEIEAERRWDELFSRSESADLLSRLADEALAEHRAGRTRALDVDEL